MRTFQQFMSLCESSDDNSVAKKLGWGGGASVTKSGEGGRIGRDRRKTDAERKKAAYKPRKDIGVQRSRSEREQQPEKERGSAALSPKEAQRKAYLERKAREKGQAKEKSASELLRKKAAPSAPHPDYKPQKAKFTGKEGRAARQKLMRAGEEELERRVMQSTGKKKSELKHKYRSWS